MKELLEKIRENLEGGISVAIIGPSASGKSWFVVNELIPELEKMGHKTKYIKIRYIQELDGDLGIDDDVEFVFFDEVETFIDREFLEGRHPEESPYYKEAYIKQVQDWHKKLKEIRNPSLYIITRNAPEEVEHLARSLRKTDWGREVETYMFAR